MVQLREKYSYNPITTPQGLIVAAVISAQFVFKLNGASPYEMALLDNVNPGFGSIPWLIKPIYAIVADIFLSVKATKSVLVALRCVNQLSQNLIRPTHPSFHFLAPHTLFGGGGKQYYQWDLLVLHGGNARTPFHVHAQLAHYLHITGCAGHDCGRANHKGELIVKLRNTS
jgi:hypothetical protein